MRIVSFPCTYCRNQIEGKYNWNSPIMTCPHCEGTVNVPRQSQSSLPKRDETNQVAALINVAGKQADSEEIHMAGLVYWAKQTAAQSNLSKDTVTGLLAGAGAISTPLATFLLGEGSAACCVAQVGVLAVGKRNVILFKIGEGIVSAGAERRDAIEQTLLAKASRSLTTAGVDSIVFEPEDASCEGFWLDIATSTGLKDVPSRLSVIGPTTALELKRAVQTILRFPSASELVKDIANLGVASRLADVRTVLGIDGTDATRAAFCAKLFSMPWKKQRIIFLDLRSLADERIQAVLGASAKHQVKRHMMRGAGWAVVGPLVAGLGYAVLRGLMGPPGQGANRRPDSLFPLVYAVAAVACLAGGFTPVFWGLSIKEFVACRRYTAECKLLRRIP